MAWFVIQELMVDGNGESMKALAIFKIVIIKEEMK